MTKVDRFGPIRLRRELKALYEFGDAYTKVATFEFEGASSQIVPGDWKPGDEEQARYAALRENMLEKLPAADEALAYVGRTPTYQDPPAAGRGSITGLSSIIVAGRDEGIESRIADNLQLAIGEYKRRLPKAFLRLLNPLHWINLLLRAILKLPAYLLSLLLPVSAEKINNSYWGSILKTAEIIIGGIGAYQAGKAFGWW